MRCIAATRHGNPLRGTRKPHGNVLDICLQSFTSIQSWGSRDTSVNFRVGRSPLQCPAGPGNPKGWRGARFPCASLLAGTERGSAPIAVRRFQALPASVVRRGSAPTRSTRSTRLKFSAPPCLRVSIIPPGVRGWFFDRITGWAGLRLSWLFSIHSPFPEFFSRSRKKLLTHSPSSRYPRYRAIGLISGWEWVFRLPRPMGRRLLRKWLKP